MLELVFGAFIWFSHSPDAQAQPSPAAGTVGTPAMGTAQPPPI